MLVIEHPTKCTIVNIHSAMSSQGQGPFVYADLIDENKKIVLSDTLTYIVHVLNLLVK